MARKEGNPTQEDLLLSILYFGKVVYGTTKLQKLAFLLQHEMGGPFEGVFDFGPYYYGPFTPEVYGAVEALQERNLVEVEERRSEMDGDVVTAQDYHLTPEGEAEAEGVVESLSKTDQTRLKALVEEYNFKSLSDLLEYTYKEYPDMAQRSEWEGA